MEDNLTNFDIYSSLFLLVSSKASYILKISLLSCLVPEIAMKKTSKLGNGRHLTNFEKFSSIFLLVS